MTTEAVVKMHIALHDYYWKCVAEGIWADRDLSDVQWGPLNLKVMHEAVVLELLERGIGHQTPIEPDELQKKHLSEDLLCHLIPLSKMHFIESVVLVYRLDPGSGRKRRSPNQAIDLIDWTRELERRAAGLRILEAKWQEVLKRRA